MAKRYKIRFPDQHSYLAAQSLVGGTTPARFARDIGRSVLQVSNDKRRYLSVGPSTLLGEDAGERSLGRQLENLDKHFGAQIVEDFRYDLESDIFEPGVFGPDDPNDPSLDDVLTLIEAQEAWRESTGEGVTIAVVDTGVDGTRPEFPAAKRVGQWQPLNDTPWTDYKGHGTMCAAIAAGARAAGGAYDGVAPGASLIACKTFFFDSELAAIYDYLIDLVRTRGLNIVATNSFGVQTGTPPPAPQDSDFVPALNEAVAAGVKVFFSAGNYHADAGGQPESCDPTSIWLHKCRADVMAVATCDLDLRMWYYSSRGPGQHFGDDNTNHKPDVTAPTPASGRVVYGRTIRSLPKGWGTSGASPQAAGLAALLLAKAPHLSREQLFAAIRDSATPLPYGATCAGAGLINCRRAVDSL